MPPKTKSTASKAPKRSQQLLQNEVQDALAWLERKSSKATRDGMARYGIPSDNAFGVSVANIHVLAKRLGRNHELADALWDTGRYEARMLTSPSTSRHLSRLHKWNVGAGTSTAGPSSTRSASTCLTEHPTPGRRSRSSDRQEEFVKRAGFVLMACLACTTKPLATRSFE